jgi:hypothetical protein
MAVPPQAVIDIATTSEEMPDWQQLPPAVPPTITMNGAPFATLPEPPVPNGWQVVVMNSAGDLTDPANIVLNEFILLQNDGGGNWQSTYEWMYEQMISAILNAGNIDQQLILLATFGLDGGMPPPNDALGLLLERGAGAQLQDWETSQDVGSQGADYIGTPASYICVGGTSYGYGQGTEAFAFQQNAPAPVSVSVTLGNNVPPVPA